MGDEHIQDFNEQAIAPVAAENKKPGMPASAELCQKLFGVSAEGIMIADIKSKSLIRANPAFCRMFGHEEADVLKLGIAGLHPPEALPGIMVGFAVQASGGNYWDTDVPCLRKDGSVFYADIHSSRTEIEGRSCVIGMFHDTTLRRRSEEALQAQERRLNFLLNANPATIYTYRASGDFKTTFLSGNVVSIMGYHPEDFMADPGFWKGHLHPVDAARIPAHMETLFAKGEDSYEYRFLHKDGTYRWMLDKSRLVRDESGQPLEIVGYWLDISGRKRAEEALKNSERKYRVLFENSGDALTTSEPPYCAFTSGNAAAVSMFRAKDEAEFLKLAPWDLSPERQPDGRLSSEKAKENIEMAIRLGSCRFDWTHRRLGGEVFPAEVLMSRIELGKKILLQGTIRDITARKLAEAELVRLHLEALERSRRLEEQAVELKVQKALAEAAGKAKSAFLANMTHEMNTPLNSVIGFSEVLADQTFGALNDKQKQYIGNIHSSGRQLLAVIENLFDLVRFDSPEAVASPAVFQLKPVLEDVVRLSGTEAAARGLHLSVEAPPDCQLESDEKLLKQALLLLLSNAVKFTPPGGRAGIRVQQAAAGVELSVWDTGIGIAAEDMDKLFQPFGQLEAFEIKKYPGSGVGLFLAKKIAEKLGGSLRAESAGPGKGSAFTITLPGSFK